MTITRKWKLDVSICPECAYAFKHVLGKKTLGVCWICGSSDSYMAFLTSESTLPLMQDGMEKRLKMEVYRRLYGDEAFYKKYPEVKR